jgi:hypothetical protein
MRSTPEDLTTQVSPNAVAEFTERLAGFQLDDWLAVAAAAERDASARTTARAMLDALIAHNGLGMRAWSVLDDVETISYGTFGQWSGRLMSRRTAAALRLARNAANTAALALLGRPLLCRDDFEVLYQPFGALVPL